MATAYLNHFFRHSLGMPVEASPHPGVRVLVVETSEGWVGLVADQPGNMGVSATNGMLRYMEKAAHHMNLAILDITWYERDSMGRLDKVTINLATEQPEFHPWQGVLSIEDQLTALTHVFGKECADLLKQTLGCPA